MGTRRWPADHQISPVVFYPRAHEKSRGSVSARSERFYLRRPWVAAGPSRSSSRATSVDGSSRGVCPGRRLPGVFEDGSASSIPPWPTWRACVAGW